MKQIMKRRNGRLTTWIFEDETLRDAEAAAKGLTAAAAAEDFEAKYFALQDLESDPEENESRELAADAGSEEILAALAAHPCTRLYLSGRFRGFRAGIGIDLRTFETAVTLPEDGPEMEAIAAELASRVI